VDSVDGKTTDSNEQGDGRSSARPRNVFAVADDKSGKDKDTDLRKRIEQLEKEIKQAHMGNKDSSSRKPSPKRGGGRNSASLDDATSASGDGTRASPDNRPCFLCKELGHWRRDCPKRKDKPKDEAGVQPVLAISVNMSPTKIYVTAKVNGEPVKCLLDSGCERSVIAADLVPNANLTPLQFSLFAANRASLDVLGDTTFPFVIDGHNFEADVSVSDKVKGFLLGSDWLEKQGAQWDFAHGTVTLGDKCIKVHRRQRTGLCRRVIVSQNVTIPARHEANVPIYMEEDANTLTAQYTVIYKKA